MRYLSYPHHLRLKYYIAADKNECTIRDKPCGDNAECENEIGSFKCTCHGGYSMEDGGCVNINECNGESAQCDPNADCRDTDGSYTCTCKEAFEDVNGDGKRCLVKLASKCLTVTTI